jgi:hypothetical protein
MSLKITHKNSTVTGTPPAAGDIDLGEIAINAADAELYVKDNLGNIRRFQNTTTGTADGVQFTQAGTGAVQRTVDSKLQDVVSVKDFGAVGDGSIDDTAAIQNAFNWWNGASRRALRFPEGNYLCTSRINALQNMSINLVGNSLFGEGGRLVFDFSATGNDASRFGLVLDLSSTNRLMRELVISGLSISGNYDEYAMLLDGGDSNNGNFLYGFVLERLNTSGRGVCVSGNTFECVVGKCYLAGSEGNGNDSSNTYVPVVPTLLVTQADIIGGTGGTGGSTRKISSIALDSNNIRGGLNGIRVDNGADDVTLRNNTVLTSWQYGLVYSATFSGVNISHQHTENCWMQYSESKWGDPAGRGFFDHAGNRWSGTSGDGSGSGTLSDPIKGDWSEWYSAASKSDRNLVLQRAGMNVIESGGAGNIMGCRQINDSFGGTMSAIRLFTTTSKPTFISGNAANGMGTEVCVSGNGSAFVNTDSYTIVGNWPKVIQTTGATTRPMLQSVLHGTGINTNNQYTPFSQSYQSSIQGSVFIALKTGLTINAPSADYTPNYGDELHFIFQQTTQNDATVAWDSIYETNGFVANTGPQALSAISFKYIVDQQGNNKWVVFSESGPPDFGSKNITTTGSVFAGSGILFDYVPGSQPSGRTVSSTTLSEYEEGTFSPDLTIGASNLNLTGNNALGTYTRIGDMAHIQITLIIASSDVGLLTGGLAVTGLPFASPNSPRSDYSTGSVSIANWATDYKNGSKTIYATNSSNSTNLDLFNGSRLTGQLTEAAFDFIAGACQLYVTMSYRVS